MKIGAAAALVLCAATLAAADEAETVLKNIIPSFSINNYAGLGAGVSVPSGDAVPLLEASSGFQFAPWIAVGGFGAGYMVDADDEEGYDAVVEERFFFASLSAGAESNLSRHLRLGLRGGWRFAGNDKIMGISAGGLSGPEADLTLRVLWRTVFD